MRTVFAALAAWLLFPVPTLAAPKSAFYTRDAVVAWADSYRHRPEPSRLPAAVQTLSKAGSLREPDHAAFHVGFIAGVLGANPKIAQKLVVRMLPLPEADQWVMVRAIAYSGLPDWKSLLAQRRAAAAGAARR